MLLCADDMIVCIKKSQGIYKTTTINEFSKIQGYKVNIQKLTIFLHTNSNQLENEIFKKSNLQQHQKKYLGLNLTKFVQDSTLNTAERNKWKDLFMD